MKQCNLCHKLKPFEGFYKDKNYKDGYESRCKLCRNGGKERPIDRNARLLQSDMKWCTPCQRELPRTMFGTENRAKDGLKSSCKECVRQWNAKERLMHRDRVRARHSRSKENGSVRAASANTAAKRWGVDDRISAADWRTLVSAYGNECMNPDCCTPEAAISLDHVVAFASGGKNRLSNLQILCKPCNSSKAANEGRDYRPFVLNDVQP